jgi:hypothetical protein
MYLSHDNGGKEEGVFNIGKRKTHEVKTAYYTNKSAMIKSNKI